MQIAETERLILQQLTINDASFILDLLNEEAFLKYIGDKKVRTTDDAIGYLQDGPLASYNDHGFGLFRVQLKDSSKPIGICGLKKRDVLDIPDLGYAFLSDHWGRGFATEAAQGVINFTKENLSLNRVAAITHPENSASIKVLAKLGFHFKNTVNLEGFERPTKLFEMDLN